jgi:PEP-CTERM motif
MKTNLAPDSGTSKCVPCTLLTLTFPIAMALGSLISVCCIGNATASNITYNFVNYPALQNGYSLTGTIVTDGTIGSLAYSGIVSASLHVTNGTTTYDLPSASDVYGTTTLIATATQLLLPPSTGNSFPGLSVGSPGYGTPHLQYDYQFHNGNYESDWYCDVDHPTTLTTVWAAQPFASNPFNLHGEPLVIASVVPEPSSLILAACGALGLLFAHRRLSAA